MNGLLIRNVSSEVISSAICAITESVFSAWSTYTLSEVLEGVSDDVGFSSDELTVEEFSIPFATNGRFVPVRTTLAHGYGRKAVSFLVGSVRRVVASPDLSKWKLIDFLRNEYDGRQADLAWYSEQIEDLSQLAEWTLWTDLVDPSEAGYKQLFLARSSVVLLQIEESLQSCIAQALSGGVDPTAARSEKAGPPQVAVVNVEEEIRKMSNLYN